MKHIDSEGKLGYGAAKPPFLSTVLLPIKQHKRTCRIKERKKAKVVISVVVGFRNGALEYLGQGYHEKKTQCSCGHQCLLGLLLYLDVCQVPPQKEVCCISGDKVQE